MNRQWKSIDIMLVWKHFQTFYYHKWESQLNSIDVGIIQYLLRTVIYIAGAIIRYSIAIRFVSIIHLFRSKMPKWFGISKWTSKNVCVSQYNPLSMKKMICWYFRSFRKKSAELSMIEILKLRGMLLLVYLKL